MADPHASEVKRAAHVAGLRSFETPTLESVERRRLQLWMLTLALLLSVAVAFVALTAWSDLPRHALLTPRTLQASLLGLVVLFSAYAIEKEIQLRRLTGLLIQERVLTAALTSRVHELSGLLAATRAMNLVLDLREVLDTILRSSLELLDGKDGSIMLARGGEELRTVAAAGASPARGARQMFGEGIAGRVAALREPLLITGRIPNEQRSTPYVLAGEPPASSMSVPLLHRGTLLGVLNVNARPGKAYTEYDLRALSLFGEHAAAAIANAQLHEEQRLLASQNLYQAMHDSLTSLPNRGLFLDRVEHALVRRRRAEHRVALLFLDLDDFKRVNDSLGHAAGDEVLVAFAERLRAHLRSGDTVARFGGDEFAVLVEDVVAADDAHQTAERLTGAMEEPFAVGGHRVWLRASVGIAVEPDAGRTAEDLLRAADSALQAAKLGGKGRIVAFEPRIHAGVLTRVELERELHSAVEGGELTVHFQPVVSLASRRVVSFEALARWQHRERGMLPASVFVPLAEQAGILPRMDRVVLRQACAAFAPLLASARESAPTLSVNVSAATLRDPRLPEDISDALQATGLRAEQLALEVCQSAVLYDVEQLSAALSRLKSLGVRLVVDDFGTGVSSISQLSRLPLDTLKVDRLLVEGLTKEASTRSLVQAIVRFAQSLSLEVVGKGIEQPDQLDELLRIGCSLGQGYFFLPPQDPATVAGYLAGRGAPPQR
ncbi:MAG: putative bifunctional diguanylate cyclase/phosphodiesterase [Acidobacteriota bacterium]